MAEEHRTPSALRRLWFVLRTLSARGRFLMGKASFVEADVAVTSNQVADAPPGRGEAQGRLLAHFRLKTGRPRTGAQGWELFEERLFEPGPHLAVRLACAYCGHHFYLQVITSMDPLAVPPGRPLSRAALYGSDWFEFTPPGMPGRPWLSCPHCEQKAPPGVEFLPTKAP